jgi:hypothetical protein
MKKLLVDQDYLVEKKEGKGGWTYVVIPEISAQEKNKLGLVRVSGFIDNYEVKQFHLLPLKDGGMFLPLNTAVRKKTGKKQGDTVQVKLYSDDSPFVIPDEILGCLLDSPKAYAFFLTLSDSNQKYYVDWVEAAKRVETKVDRILKMVERLENGLKFYDWVKQEI